MKEGTSRLRWLRAATLMLLGLVAAWSWLFLVSKWGPAKRIDILTFKAGVTSRVMRTLLRFPESTMHEHDAAGMSSIYATPEYYSMTEQNQDAAKFQPDKYAVFYLFEDIHMGELPEAPPTATLRLDNGEQLTVYYTFALAGIGMQQTAAGIIEGRSQVIRTALQFIAGFTIVFTATGSLAGLAGEKLHISGFMENWNRPLGIASGLGMLIVGVWVGASAGAPGLCRLPVPAKLLARRPCLARLKVMCMGSAFPVGWSPSFTS